MFQKSERRTIKMLNSTLILFLLKNSKFSKPINVNSKIEGFPVFLFCYYLSKLLNIKS
jgi:hypothetical protein